MKALDLFTDFLPSILLSDELWKEYVINKNPLIFLREMSARNIRYKNKRKNREPIKRKRRIS